MSKAVDRRHAKRGKELRKVVRESRVRYPDHDFEIVYVVLLCSDDLVDDLPSHAALLVRACRETRGRGGRNRVRYDQAETRSGEQVPVSPEFQKTKICVRERREDHSRRRTNYLTLFLKMEIERSKTCWPTNTQEGY